MSDMNPKSSPHHSKPPLSYIALITLAIKNSPLQMVTLNEVYHYIITTFPYFQKNREKWQNTVRHNLSLNDCFIKIPRRFLGIPGKGNFWALHPQAGGMFNHGSLLRRRRRFRTRSSCRSRSVTGYDDDPRLERNSASVHHIDSKHHFDLYGAQRIMNLAAPKGGMMMLHCGNPESQDRSLVPSPQYSLTPHHTLYGWNVFPSYPMPSYEFLKL